MWRRLARSLSTLLLHSRHESGLAIAVTAAPNGSDMGLTARAEGERLQHGKERRRGRVH